MAHITITQLNTILSRIVTWVTGKFAAKNATSGKLEYADMPVVVLASMGSELDGTSTQRPMSAGSTYFLPAEQGTSARIMFVTALGQPVKISDPDSGVIYCNAYTGLLYRWDSTTNQMVSVGGGGDGLRKVYVNIASSTAGFSSLDALHSAETSGVYQVIDQSSQKIIGILVVSSDNNPYLVTQWLFSTLVLSDEFSGSLTGAEYTNGRAHIIHRFYNVSNTSYSDVPLNTWGQWKVYGLTLDEMTDIFNSKVSTVSVNGGTPAQPDTNGNVNLVVEAGGLTEADIEVSSNQDGTVDFTFGEDTYTINLNHTHENMARIVKCTTLPQTLADDTIYVQVDDLTTPTEIQSLYLFGLEFVGGGGDDGLPAVTSPADDSTINVGENLGSGVSTTITVKAKNLSQDLVVAISGTGLTMNYGQQTGLTSVTLARNSAGAVFASLDIVFTGVGGISNGSLTFTSGNDTLSTATVKVTTDLPDGYTRLEYVDNAEQGIDTNIYATTSQDTSTSVLGTTWELDIQSSIPASTQYLINTNEDVGHYVNLRTTGHIALGGEDDQLSCLCTTRYTYTVKFYSNKATVSCDGETKTKNYSNNIHNNYKVCLFNMMYPHVSQYGGKQYTGRIYSVRCLDGGSFNAVPAMRNSDNAEGLYDKANDVFYPLH